MLKPKKTYPNASEYTALKMHGNFTNDQILVKKKLLQWEWRLVPNL